MSIVKEVGDQIEIVTDKINNIRRVYSAVRNGKKYLKTPHPDRNADVAAMCIEMRRTLQSIATASSIVTHFSYNISCQAIAAKPCRSNDNRMHHKTQTMSVKPQLDYRRGHCRKIDAHAHELETRVKESKLSSMLKFFGLNSGQRERELSRALVKVYDDEMQFLKVMSGICGWVLSDGWKPLGKSFDCLG